MYAEPALAYGIPVIVPATPVPPLDAFNVPPNVTVPVVAEFGLNPVLPALNVTTPELGILADVSTLLPPSYSAVAYKLPCTPTPPATCNAPPVTVLATVVFVIVNTSELITIDCVIVVY